MSITVLVQSSNNIIVIGKKSSFSYKNFIVWALPKTIEFMQVIWVVEVGLQDKLLSVRHLKFF